jgi:hypothetical protein
LLIAALLLESGVIAAGTTIGIRSFEFQFGCVPTNLPAVLIYPGAGVALTQTVIMGLTVAKHTVAVRNGWGRTPVVSLMIRDGTTVFIVMSGLMVLGALCSIFHPSVAGLFFSWGMSILCCIVCFSLHPPKTLISHYFRLVG